MQIRQHGAWWAPAKGSLVVTQGKPWHLQQWLALLVGVQQFGEGLFAFAVDQHIHRAVGGQKLGHAHGALGDRGAAQDHEAVWVSGAHGTGHGQGVL